jgi:hypothetical protein
MAGTGKFYHALTVTVGGVDYPTPGSSVVIPRSWTTNGNRPPLVLPFEIPRRTSAAPYHDAVTIFNIDQAPDFTRLEVHLLNDGDSIYLAEYVDAVTSSTDNSPAGTAEHANILHVEWNAPYISGCPDRLVNTTLSNAAGLDSDNVAIGLTHASTTVGRLYGLQAVTLITARDIPGYVVAIQ